jgi:hypothetical protein
MLYFIAVILLLVRRQTGDFHHLQEAGRILRFTPYERGHEIMGGSNHS